MALYEYRCRRCGNQVEVFLRDGGAGRAGYLRQPGCNEASPSALVARTDQDAAQVVHDGPGC